MIKLVSHHRYRIPMTGHVLLHQSLVWYATEDDKVLGVVVRDRADDDFSWVVLTMHADGYRAIDLDHSKPTFEVATAELHAAMESARYRNSVPHEGTSESH